MMKGCFQLVKKKIKENRVNVEKFIPGQCWVKDLLTSVLFSSP